MDASSTDGSSTIAAVLPTGDVLPLMPAGSAMHFAYLLDAAAGGRWVHRWGAGITAPLAIGIMSGRDTIIVRIGERG